jgi:hypothetical protein
MSKNILNISNFGWWFGTFGLFFPSVGNVIIPTDELHHFSEGYVYLQPENSCSYISQDLPSGKPT